MSDAPQHETSEPEELRGFTGPGEASRRDARKEGILLSAAMDKLRTRLGPDPVAIGKQVDFHIARVATLSSLAEAEENAAVQAALLKNAEASSRSAVAALKHNEALVRWTKIMVVAVILQAAAAITNVIVMLCRRA